MGEPPSSSKDQHIHASPNDGQQSMDKKRPDTNRCERFENRRHFVIPPLFDSTKYNLTFGQVMSNNFGAISVVQFR
jgi:hypothetical protein